MAQPNDEAMWQAVTDGEADALICDAWQTVHLMARFPDLTVTYIASEPGDFGFALPKGSPRTAELDAYLRVQTEGGAYRALLVQHFGEALASSIFDED